MSPFRTAVTTHERPLRTSWGDEHRFGTS